MICCRAERCREFADQVLELAAEFELTVSELTTELAKLQNASASMELSERVTIH